MKKDWKGNKKSIFATLGASSHGIGDRQIDDYYATDPQTIVDLFKVEDFGDTIWEPACGEGHLSKKIEDYGKSVLSTDLVQRGGYGTGNIDFLKQKGVWNGDIITNPPYKYAQEFVEQSMKLIKKSTVAGLKVAMFLKLTFLEGQKRKKMFAKYPPKYVYVFSQRQNCAKNGDFHLYPSSAVCYCWFVWEKNFKGETTIKWI